MTAEEKVLDNRKRVKAWRKANPIKKAEGQRRYRAKKKVQAAIVRAAKKALEPSPEERNKLRLEKIKAWQKANREKVHAIHVKRKDKRRAYEKVNRQKIRGVRLKWESENQDRMRKYGRDNYRKSKDDPQARMRRILRGRLNHALLGRGAQKHCPAIILLGCPIEDFKIYIESKFEVGMTWKNHGHGKGKWNIDHIMPCAIFDLTKPEHQKRCFHFSNMQPMWSSENCAKGAKITTNQFQLL